MSSRLSAHRRGGVSRHSCRRHAVLAGLGNPASARRSPVLGRQVPRFARRLPQRAEGPRPPTTAAGPRMGVIASALRVAEFGLARVEAEKLYKADPTGPEAMTLYGDALWSSGLFQEAEAKYRDALAAAPDLARGHHGMAKALAARSQLGDAMNEAQAALRLSPRDLEIHHTVGTIYERQHKYEEAAAAYSNYVNLLPNKDHSEKADWSRAEIRFLRSFGQRVPFEIGSRHRRQALHGRLPAGEREGRRARQGQRRRGAGLRRRHRRGEHRHHAPDGAAARHHAGHLHAQRRRRPRRAARPAAGAHRFAGARLAQAAQRARA